MDNDEDLANLDIPQIPLDDATFPDLSDDDLLSPMSMEEGAPATQVELPPEPPVLSRQNAHTHNIDDGSGNDPRPTVAVLEAQRAELKRQLTSLSKQIRNARRRENYTPKPRVPAWTKLGISEEQYRQLQKERRKVYKNKWRLRKRQRQRSSDEAKPKKRTRVKSMVTPPPADAAQSISPSMSTGTADTSLSKTKVKHEVETPEEEEKKSRDEPIVQRRARVRARAGTRRRVRKRGA